ncbi:PAS domain-containing sensor histidine kinase [Pseudobacteroides cellulosolvens]|uniref:histidine kinase n=1 Tax=Pseudobacteroides cellulosolvens ATCC 35603 = DSM 2933 TaxID=398512 RepID=A0A0L6JWR3_9FIRM|nr:PAS domain-containing sensor histidine kinase [Pseudobacteroides cellulosolvens]KNY30283.1 multi-sensor signal transduction histidine kinase [Pseudobacteroides cellulosolvens ATCC 35603 = DSM 2933]
MPLNESIMKSFISKVKNGLYKKVILNLFKSSSKIVLLYITLSSVWILFSDSFLKSLKLSSSTMAHLSIVKGWFFVAVTGVMLYVLIDRSMKKLKLSEEELRKKDEMYRLVINGTTDGLWECNIENNSLYISPNLEDKIDAKFNDISNPLDIWNKIVHPDDINVLLNSMEDYISRKISKLSCECRVKNKEGDYFWIQLKGQGIWNSHGKIHSIIGTHTDITEKKLVEEKLKHASHENLRLLNEIIEYDRLKTEFFTNISHEFRTPLNVILGSVQLIESYRDNKNPDEIKNKLHKNIASIRQNCYRLLKIINNLIDITKIDSGFLELNQQSCNIVDVIERVTLSVAEFIESKSLSLIFDTDTEEKYMVCDINKIERVMLNLLSNATKFNRPGGSIFVKLTDMGDNILISIRDTGIGVPKDKKSEIFERFRQLNTSLTKESEGSGIGLSIVKSLIDMHGGEISIESELGQFTEFIIKLPANAETSCVQTANEDTKSRKYLYMASVEFSDIYS